MTLITFIVSLRCISDKISTLVLEIYYVLLCICELDFLPHLQKYGVQYAVLDAVEGREVIAFDAIRRKHDIAFAMSGPLQFSTSWVP